MEITYAVIFLIHMNVDDKSTHRLENNLSFIEKTNTEFFSVHIYILRNVI